MKDIFREDRTINIGPTISSMASNNTISINEEYNLVTPVASLHNEQSPSFSVVQNCKQNNLVKIGRQKKMCVYNMHNLYISNWLQTCIIQF